MTEVREYLELDGGSPFADWFARLNPKAAAKVATGLTRLAAGNFSTLRVWVRKAWSTESDLAWKKLKAGEILLGIERDRYP